jgi:Ca2+-binding RTX toxin-like protein
MAAITSVSASTANGAYKIGDVISIVVTFTASVTVDTTGGTPHLLLETGSVDRLATYVSGSGTTDLVFSYTVQAGDASSDLDYFSSSALSLQSGTIRDFSNVDATLTLATPGTAGSLGANKAIIVDGVRPTAASIVVADTALAVGETSLVTITFSEAVSGFSNADLSIENGTLSNVSSSDGGITWTATFTPSSSNTDTSNIIALDNTGVSDVAGNSGTGVTQSNNYAIDTLRPTATIAVADNALTAGETSLVTITFSEAVTGLTTADLSIQNGSLAALSSGDGGITWTATLTPTSSVTDTSNIITLNNTGVADLAGNSGSGSTDSNNYSVDTVNDPPSLTGDRTATMVKGTTYQITSADLSFTDPDDVAANVTFTVSSLVNGSVLVNGTAALSFTGAQLAAGNVSFRHTGTGVSPASFNVTADDGNEDVSAPVAQTFSITVTSAPAVTNPLANQVATEDTVFSFVVPANAFTDEDGNTLTYTATLANGSALPSWLNFNASTRTFSGTPLNDNVGAVAVKVTASDGSSTASDEFTLTVANTNDVPTSITLSANSVDENSAGGTVIGTLAAIDPDKSDTVTLSLVGNGANRFAISGNELVVVEGAGLDFEVKSSYTIAVSATDAAGAVKDQTFTIKISDLDDEIKGGKGDNILEGGDGAEWIDGKAGDDRMTGGGGPDTFIFGRHYGRDVITDFDPTEGDRIDLSHAAGILSFRDLRKHHIEDTGKDLLITTDDGSVLVLKGVDLGDLSRDSFVF